MPYITKNLDPERSRDFVAVAVQLGKKIFFKKYFSKNKK